MALVAFMMLIIASWDAEWNAAATKPQAHDKTDEEDNPCHGSNMLVYISPTMMPTLMASDHARRFWPYSWMAWMLSDGNNGDIHTTRLLIDRLLWVRVLPWLHRSLSRLHHHWLLSWLHHRLSWLHHRLSWLHHRLSRLHHWLSWLHHLLLSWLHHDGLSDFYMSLVWFLGIHLVSRNKISG